MKKAVGIQLSGVIEAAASENGQQPSRVFQTIS